jgi:hypothetical protein
MTFTKRFRFFQAISMIAAIGLFLVSCDDPEAPEPENEVEEFTYIELIFTNENNPNDVRKGIWEDADGFGPGAPVILQQPTLAANTPYVLTFVMENRLLNPVENLLDEIEDEEDEHQIFFEFDTDIFSSPTGVGNVANRNGAINYLDQDTNGLPVGLRTRWVTGEPVNNARFRVILGHQPGVKSATSAWDSGDIDWDITFQLTIQ